ncbi:MAG: acyltransferase [Nitrospiraceae bacterium]|nr:acyltransferase [Nitrospiraceae bacterium]
MKIKAGLFQFAPAFGDIHRNVDRALAALASASAELIVLPELFSTGYQFTSADEVRELAEEVPSGFTTQRLADFSRERSIFIVAGIAERDGDRIFNSAVLTGPKGFIGVYRKTHLFHEEKLWFSPGDTGFRVWETAVGRIGIMVCFDWFFPESARTLSLMGADIIVHPANLVLPFCPDAMVTRCLENRVFAVTANRTGSEERGGRERLDFIGASQITSCRGNILARASRDREEYIEAEIDPAESRDKQLNQYNNLFTDRRPEKYR